MYIEEIKAWKLEGFDRQMNPNFTKFAVKRNNPCTDWPGTFYKILLRKLFAFNITILFSSMSFMVAGTHDILSFS